MVSQLWADVKYHVPTGLCFSPKASGFYPFGDATDLAGEGGVGDVVWLIQAPAWNQTCHSTNDRCEALASLKGCFLCFCFCAPSIYPLNPFQRNATTSNCPLNAKSHPAGMRICYAIFAGISLRLCSISLRSFRITFAKYTALSFKNALNFQYPWVLVG